MSQRWRSTPISAIGGTLSVPGDKSISHRALLFNALANGTAEVRNLLEGEDCLRTLEALRQMGVSIEQQDAGHYLVKGVGLRGLKDPAAPLDMGNSGTAMRLFAGALAGQSFASSLVGDASLTRRPMARIIRPLGAMGAKIFGKANRPPLSIQPVEQLLPIRYGVPVPSAQVKSAILLAGLSATGTTQVAEPAPTRDHSERLLSAMGANLQVDDLLVTLQGPAELTAIDIDVPADFSSAAFFMVAGTLAPAGSLRINAVGMNPTRTGLLEALALLGADISLENQRDIGGEPVADIVVTPAQLKGAVIPAHIAPLAIDEYPILFAAAAFAKGTTRFEGVAELRHKESDRIAAMETGLRALGIACESTDDVATVNGGTVRSGAVESHGDHRIAMAFAIAGSVAAGPIEIGDVGPVATSFPSFRDCCKRAGLVIEALE